MRFCFYLNCAINLNREFLDLGGRFLQKWCEILYILVKGVWNFLRNIGRIIDWSILFKFRKRFSYGPYGFIWIGRRKYFPPIIDIELRILTCFVVLPKKSGNLGMKWLPLTNCNLEPLCSVMNTHYRSFLCVSIILKILQEWYKMKNIADNVWNTLLTKKAWNN